MRSAFVISLLVIASSVFASWQKIAQLDAKATCCFFFDDVTGLAGSGEYNGTDVLKIWRTNDGGSTWLPCQTPSGIGQVTSIRMKTALIGYASIFSNAQQQYSIWKTTDGGYSWFNDSRGNIGYTTDVWVTSAALIKTKWSGPQIWPAGGPSINDGASFSSPFFSGQYENSNGLYFTSDLIGVATAGPMTGASWYTTNGGVSWNAGGKQAEAWSAYGYAGSNVFFAIAELQKELHWSTNGGRSWTRRFSFGSIFQNGGSITTGHIAGKGNVMYVQTQGEGMVRSAANDSGLSWRVVGGPQNIVDSRAFYVGGCAGELVIAFDLDGSVWKTTDGGDGTMGSKSPLALTHINFPLITACASLSRIGTLSFNDCGEFIIKSVTLENDPGKMYTVDPFSVPDTLFAGDVDTFRVTFDPKGNPGTYPARLRIRGELHKLGNVVQIDSLIQITASATAVAPKLTASTNTVTFRELSVCEAWIDTLITLRNEGCDTLTITSGPTPAGQPFVIQSFTLPHSLPPDSSISFRISYQPTVGGSFTGSTTIQAQSQGKTQQIEILIDGKARFGQGALSVTNAQFDFKTLSICSTDSLNGFITNTGCDTLIVDSAALSGDTDFKLVIPTLVGAKLRPGDTIWFTVHLVPGQKGSRSGLVTIVTHNEHGIFPMMRATFPLVANILDGTRSISQSLTSIDFDTTDLCTERDSLITLRNTGCDSILVTDVALQGAGFSLSGITLPIRLAPGESVDIGINTVLDTVDGKTFSTALIVFTSNASNQLTSIPLRRAYKFARLYGVHLDLSSPRGGSESLIKLLVVGEKGLGLPGSGIDRFSAKLGVNQDLLHFVSADGPNVTTFTDSVLTITNVAELASTSSGALAELTYRVYLTKDSTTGIAMDDVSLSGGDTSTCTPTILGMTPLGQPAFSYIFKCGDHILQRFLETGLALNIISIRPNPARDEVTIETVSQSSEPFSVKLYNEAGELLREQAFSHSAIRLMTSDLPSGSYTARIEQAGSATTARFVIER